MSKKITLTALLFLACFLSRAAYVPVAVTGYNADVIANGSVSVAASTTADVDGAGYYFLDSSFTALGTPTYALPTTGIINSATTSGLSFQMAGSSVNNSLRLATQGASGTLTLTTPQSAGIVYLMITSGSGTSTVDVTVTFTDATTQVFSGNSISDWYNGTPVAVQGFGRTSATALDMGGGTTNPRLYQLALTLSAANYFKQVASITITKTNATGTYPNVMGVSISTPCAVPAAQPTALSLTTISTSQINGSFTAASPAADQYLVVRYPAGATPVAPANGTTYTAGNPLGTGFVIQAGTATTFTATGLQGNTSYDFYVYSYNVTGCVGPIYRTTTPLTGTQATSVCTGPSGLITVGPTGSYTTLTAALSSLSGGIGGSVVLELQSTYTSTSETFPIIISSNNACYGPSRTVTIRPAAGANGLSITGANAGPTVLFNGAQYVTIDGTPGGSSSSSTISVTTAGSTNATNLNIINTNTAGAAVMLDTQASNNKIKYCDLQGQNTTAANVPSTMAGVVYFGNAGANGNDNNTIDHCNIHSSGSGTTTPSLGIYSLGYDNQSSTAAYALQFNDNDTISNCNIYDYFSSGNSAGIEANYGNTGWAITGNSFFQTSSITISTSGAYNRAVWLIPYRGNYAGEVGNGFQVSGNYMGGTAPQCGGTPYTIASGSAGYFEGIRLELADAATAQAATSVQGNTIKNIFITTSTSADPFHGINVTSGKGNVNIGTVTGNTIGTATGTGGSSTGGITITGTGAVPSHMIILGGTYTLNVQNNVIGNILMTETGSYFSGIFTNTAITANISNNIIGSLTTPNSIYASNTGTTSGRYINGIQVGSGAPVLTITGNKISNMSCNYLYSGSSASQVVGINIGSSSAVINGITGNTIRNLYNASLSTASTSSSALMGINCVSTAATGVNISQNVIDSLVSSASSGAVNVMGMYLSNTTSVVNSITKNYIHSLSAASTSAIITGIYHNAGTSSFVNNMIRLGINPDGTAITTPLTIAGITSASSSATSFNFNSIYIGGTGVTSAASNNTFALRRTGTAVYDIRDNIFANVRSNASTGGAHYALVLNSLASLPICNYNVYQYSGTGGKFASVDGATTAFPYYNAASPWITGDANSVAGNPQFINPAGTAAAGDLHISATAASVAEATGTAIASVTDDYDGQTRSTLTPTDIGADAGNFIALPPCTAPTNQPTGLTLSVISATQINGSFTASVPAADGYIVVMYYNGATATAPVNGTIYTAGNVLGSGTVISAGSSTTFSATGLTGNTAYTFYVYAYSNNCIGGPVYKTATPLTGTATTTACSSTMSGIVSVGPTGTYTTLTNALNYLNTNGMGGAVTLELQSTYTSASETFPIMINNFGCLSASNPLTIRPAAGANGLSISGSNAGPTIFINGAKYVTIDGTPGGSSSSSAISVTAAGSLNATNLNIINTSTTGTAIKLDSQATSNRIRYCDLQGQNTTDANVPTSLAGVVYFGANGTYGNDNNVIDHCNIHGTAAASYPSIGIYSLGATNTGLNINFNDNDTISNNNIYDYFLATGNSAGIELNQGVNAWTISGNSLFQTSTLSPAAAGYNRGIWLIPDRTVGTSAGNGFSILNNYIGGSAPLCAGTNPYTISSTLSNYLEAMRLEVADPMNGAANPSSVQGNTVANISVTATGQTGDPFHGLWASSRGNLNIGTITGNTFGNLTGNTGAASGGISIAAGSGSSTHTIIIANANAGTTPIVNIRKNKIGNIQVSTANANITGIFVNQYATATIDSNTVGSTAVNNSIAANLTSSTGGSVVGINIPSGSSTTYPLTVNITNNTVGNLSEFGTSTGTQVIGIGVAKGTISSSIYIPSITGNTIKNLYTAGTSTSTVYSAPLIGINMSGYYGASTISRNIVDSLVASGNAAVNVYGIMIYGITSANNVISRNFIHSLDATGGNTSAIITGIYNYVSTSTVVNNMIRLGIKPDGTSITTPLTINGILSAASYAGNYYYFNSVYIGGTGVGTTTSNSYAFRRTASYAYIIKDNIFSNVRSNATTGGTHYAMFLSANSSLPSCNYNVYQFSGTGGAMGTPDGGTTVLTSYSTTTPWIAGDTNSQAADPQYLTPAGTAATADLHINPAATSTPVEAKGTPIAGITDDYDGQTRSLLTPTDIGADAGFFGMPSCITAPTAPLNGSTICSGTITFSWPQAGATYDVYLNSGSTATTIVSASQTDTFYTTTIAGGTYTWKVIPKNTAGSATGCSSFTFTAIAAPAISAQPQAQTVCKGTPVTMSVTATGAGITYQWQKNGTAITGATNASYSIPAAAITDTGNYVVVINGTSPCNSLSSAVAHLTVNRVDTTITASGSTVFCTGGSVTLTSNAGTGNTYQWKQGTTAISGATTAGYTASVTGNYRVLVTNTATGCTDSSAVIAVSGNTTPPSAITPSGTAAYCQGDSVALNANTGTGLSYQWQKGGVNITGATNATYYASSTGSYTVAVSVGTGCTGTSSATVVSMNTLPAATATAAGATTFCQGGSVTLNGNTGSGLTYQWLQNGTNISSATNAAYSVSATGTYTIKVTDANGCKNTSSGISVTVNALPSAVITPAGPTTFCQGSTVVLNANTGTGLTYQWLLNGGNISGATNGSYIATGTGSYTVVVTNSNNCSATSAATAVTVNAPPSAVVTPSGTVAICQGSTAVLSAPAGSGLTYQWLSGSANISGATASSYTVSAAGSYSVIVSSTSCSVTSAATTVTVNPLPAATVAASGPLTFCANDSVIFTTVSGAGLTYQWKFNAGAISGATNASYKANISGSYTVTVTNANGCSATSTANVVTVNPLPLSTIFYTTPLEFCDGGAVVLNTTATGASYQWLQNGVPIASANNNYFIAYQTGNYSIQITSAYGCNAISQPVSVTVHPLPQPTITRNGYTLSTGTYVTYRWYLNGNPITNGGNGSSYTATQNGAYYVTVTDSNGCSNTSAVVFINNVGVKNITPETVKIYPNPASDVVFIDAPSAVNVQLRDLSGRVVLTQEKATKIHLGGMTPGIYMIYVYDVEGRLVKAEKLFKAE